MEVTIIYSFPQTMIKMQNKQEKTLEKNHWIYISYWFSIPSGIAIKNQGHVYLIMLLMQQHAL